MWSQKRTVLPPAAAMSLRAPSRMAWSSAGVRVYWLAFENGRNLTLPRLTPSMKKGLPSRVVTRFPATFGKALAAAAAGATGIACSISAASAEAPSIAAAKKFLGEEEDDFLAKAGEEKTPAERTRRARASTAAAENGLRRRSIALFSLLTFSVSSRAGLFAPLQIRERRMIKSACFLIERKREGECLEKELKKEGVRGRDETEKEQCPWSFGAPNVFPTERTSRPLLLLLLRLDEQREH